MSKEIWEILYKSIREAYWTDEITYTEYVRADKWLNDHLPPRV